MIISPFPKVSLASVIIWAGMATGAVEAEELRSSTIASELASLMAERKLEAFAAQDPDTSTRFLAALLIPNVQLLVVAAEYPNVAELQSQLAQNNYRDVYAALHQPATQSSRFFLIDLACDGLGTGADNVDVLYEHGNMQTLFNGDWKNQGLSEATYRKRLEGAEVQYTRLLTVLRSALKAGPATAQTSR